MIPNLLRAGLQSGSIMTVADITTQMFIEKRTLQQPQERDQAEQRIKLYEPSRTIRWSLAGLALHGPYFYYAFSKIDQHFAQQAMTFGKVLHKTAIAQFIAFPPYLIALFTMMGFLEGAPSIVEHVQTKIPDAFAGGCVFWPVVNMINFAFVPPTLRVPYLAGVGSIWNCFLSWLNAHQEEESANVLTKSIDDASQ